jgi:SPP1 gp7 family putative phage head morphogenesis protein
MATQVAALQRTADAGKSTGGPPLPEELRRLRREARERFLAGRKAETQYAIQLSRVAKHVGDIVLGMAPQGELFEVAAIAAMLNRYADLLKPWAESVAARMVSDVAQRDAAAWVKHGREIGRALKREIDQAPTGAVMRRAIAEQAEKITSIPRDAAQRLFKLTTEGIVSGTRAKEIAAQVMASGSVSKSTSMMLARTGVSTTATALTRARAEYIGADSYIWRTSRDGDVRPSHKKMEGKVVRWDSPPTLDGWTGHVGEYANCRCFPQILA